MIKNRTHLLVKKYIKKAIMKEKFLNFQNSIFSINEHMKHMKMLSKIINLVFLLVLAVNVSYGQHYNSLPQNSGYQKTDNPLKAYENQGMIYIINLKMHLNKINAFYYTKKMILCEGFFFPSD